MGVRRRDPGSLIGCLIHIFSGYIPTALGQVVITRSQKKTILFRNGTFVISDKYAIYSMCHISPLDYLARFTIVGCKVATQQKVGKDHNTNRVDLYAKTSPLYITYDHW